jgi:hypothetical protein
LYDLTEKWLKNSGLSTDSNRLKRTLAKKGAFHIARIASFIWRGDDNWNPANHDLKQEVGILENYYRDINSYIERAYSILENILREDVRYVSDLDNALKSGNLDAEIDQELHTTYNQGK